MRMRTTLESQRAFNKAFPRKTGLSMRQLPKMGQSRIQSSNRPVPPRLTRRFAPPKHRRQGRAPAEPPAAGCAC